MASIEKRTTKAGDVSYRVKVRLRGYPTQTASFKRLTDARRWEQKTETAIREGRHFNITESRKHTLADAIDRYIKVVLPKKPKNIRDQTQQLKWWKDQLGSYLLSDISAALVAEGRDQLASEVTIRKHLRSKATVNRYLAVLSHLFTIAIKEWDWVQENSVLKVAKLKEPRGRVRFLSEDERSRLLTACKNSKNQDLYLAVVLCISTGARKMEIMSLRWSDVDLQRFMIVIHETKNGDRRKLPLQGHALELMRTRSKVRQLNSDLIFPNKTGSKPIDLRAPWEAALKEAGIEDFRFHDLRHSAASYLVMNGATIAEIAEILGHKTLQMVQRYAHLSDAHTSKVVASMNEKIFG